MDATVSFWEQEEFLQADVCIVGAGIIGLSVAASLVEKAPRLRVVVLERSTLPTGASTKNAGFACYGSPTELWRDIQHIGEDATCQLVAQRKRGLERLRARLGDEAIGYEPCGGYELLWGPHCAVLDWLDHLNKLMMPIFGRPYAARADERIREFGFGSMVTHLVALPNEGRIHTGRMMRSLFRYVAERGVLVLSGSPVEQVVPAGFGVELIVSARSHRELRFSARAVVVATNALSTHLADCVAAVPGRGQVLITEPVEHLPWDGVFHFDEGYYYFRNVGKRILFGGGRNLDFEGETTDELALTDRIQAQLETYLHTVIAPGRELRIAHRWAGVMGFRTPPLPAVEWCGERILRVFGCNGMGVALGSLVADDAAEQLKALLL
ncbi:MAG: FAD-dependent oxidoreductase [Bacteroidota bacterium]|nr:FAD-binding oxidoreductase [Candidatus Kapabacteria bacterium]MCS7302832.1 FAD-binding oxidoreductase [Candidatus Kapabacteria bacterium]MCX7936987.1 FAD-binding oxidoreductase [Chlorobiota bacterium]MDW8075628.1 FAD-dependent oxidoreductase [Bacteroidota bacterium]MDW8272131.1 FAD-dependent oxidoreductase [Bacteroidota bacterium]